MDFLWNINTEKRFFIDALEKSIPPEKLFYKLKSGYFAYVPKSCTLKGQTIQSRNALIGSFTEKWVKSLFEPIAKKFKLFALNDVECSEIGLTKRSRADLAFCTKDSKCQSA